MIFYYHQLNKYTTLKILKLITLKNYKGISISNNNLSMKLIDDTINKFINNKFNTLEITTQISNDIKLDFKNEMIKKYKIE